MGSVDAPQYPDVPLPPPGEGHHIRLLHILPGSFNSELRANLSAVNLAEDPQYDALSYTWGKATEYRTILLNGKYNLPMTDNLYNAIRRMRSTLKRRILWVDALCINQFNANERAAQVEVMGSIYRNAQCVNVWLGEPRALTGLTPGSVWHAWKFFQTWTHDWSRQWPEQGDVITMLAHNDTRLLEDAISNTLPYWCERAWVVQEFLLARQLRFYSGARSWRLHEIDFAAKEAGLSCPELMKFNSALRRFVSYHTQVSYLSKIKMIPAQEWEPLPSTDKNACGLVEAAQLIRDAQTSDVKDLIYSLLGLINSREAALVNIDYTLSFQEICASATYASLRGRSNHFILRAVKFSQLSEPEDKISWAVNFADRSVFERFTSNFASMFGPLATFGNPRACGGLAGLVQIAHSPTRLVLSGVKCGRVVSECQYTTVNATTLQWLTATAVHEFGNSTNEVSDAILRRQFGVSDEDIRAARQALHGPDPLPKVYDFIHLFTQWNTIVLGLLGLDAESYRPQWLMSPTQISLDWDAIAVSGGKSFFVMQSGLFGFAPCSIAVGDEIVVVPHSDVCTSPFLILRPYRDGYKFRGLAYVHGCMHEAFWNGFHELEKFGERIVIY